MAEFPGLLVPGNIDLSTRPVVKNPDGTISTVLSTSFEDEGGSEVLVPMISDDGRVLTQDEAWNQYVQTKKHLGIFTDMVSATEYAKQLHEAQAKQYGAK